MKPRTIIIKISLLCIFSVLFVSIPPAANAAFFDPGFRFSTIETDHFVLHYHQGTEEIAHRAARIAEEVHLRLTSALQWTPGEKTQIVLVDSSDLANGMTTVIPYNMIYLYLSTPFPDSSIAEYDDWLENLILHEYVHVLTMDPSRGFPSVMRSIFGKPVPGLDPLSFLVFLFSAPPNVFMPYWWLEGMATWAETEFTTAGRGRSSYYEMIFRMAVLEDRIPQVSQIDGHVPWWPDGSLPYIYGMMLEKYIAQTYGNDKPGKISYRQAGRAPFFISDPPYQFTGKDYVQLYNEMAEWLRKEQNAKIETLKTVPLTGFRVMPLEGERVTNPHYSPDGKYFAVDRRDPNRHEEIVIMDAASLEEIDTIRRLPSDHSMSWSPDGSRLYFTQSELRGLGGYNLYQDIYAYDMESGFVDRITKGLRTKDIDVSRDGNSIVFVQVRAEEEAVVTYDIASGRTTEFLVSGTEGSLTGPRWSPDGGLIVFSGRDNTGNSFLKIYDVGSGGVTTLLRDEHANIYPAWTPDGTFIIFTSDRTGVYNLFAQPSGGGNVLQVTHLLGGAFHPDISPDGKSIAFSLYHSKGFSIAEIPFDHGAWMADFSPRVRPLWGGPADKGGDLKEAAGMMSEARKDESLPVGEPAGTTADISGNRPFSQDIGIEEKGSYSPLSTLMPRFWLPTLYADHEDVVFGALTAGQDVLGYHTLYLQPAYGLSGEPYIDTFYSYDRWYPLFYLWGYSLPVQYAELFHDPVTDKDEDYWERRTSLTAGISIPLISLESQYSLIGGYRYEKDEHLTDIEGRTVDGLEVFEGRRDHLFIGLSYNGALKYPYSISREEGRSFTLMYRGYAKNLGSDISQREYSADYSEYIGLWRHHVLSLNLRGATSDGDLIAQQAFRIGGNATGVNEYPLRGFAAGFQTGKSIVTGSLEYRFPVYYLLSGWGTKPFFWDRLHAAVFVDAGNVWGYNKDFDTDDISVGIGAEVRFDMVLGYKLPITPAIGIAQGVTEDGETQVYITIYAGL